MKNKQNKPRRRRIDVNVEELDQIVDRAREAPLSDTDYDKLKTALHALVEKLLGLKKSEKLASVFGDDKAPASPPPSARSAGARAPRRARLQRRAQGLDLASAAGFGRSLPGLRPRQSLRAEGAQGSG